MSRSSSVVFPKQPADSSEVRKSERERLSLPPLEHIHSWLVQGRIPYLQSPSPAEPAPTFFDEWPFVIRFVEDGRPEVDTNWIERQIKPFVIGRKTWLFADTPNGAGTSAILYTLPYAQTLAGYKTLLHWNFKQR